MFLKRLVLSGFKSFADRTEFEFDRGITCIVGPNGCGKSNLVDAVRWVLGEQSARSLRGRQMLDVIFAGSATRRSAGLAQVDLVFDNSDHFLPTDQTELTVSRRLYRSGQSEYLLNKQPCRLRDIRELFLDTGVGVDAYSVIEQGRVDVLLQANPIERRAIFEEAAGISKYKLRKTEAVRKLERVGQNLLRLDDVIQEVERQLRSIKYQAGKAQSYQRYWQRLCELRAAHALAEFHKLLTAEEALQQQLRGASDQVAALRSQIEHLETRSSHLTANANQLDQQASQAEDHLLALQSQITTYQERTEQQRHRLAEHQQAASKARHRCWSCSQQVRHLHARVADQQRQCQQLDQELAQQRQQISQLADRDEQLGAQLAAAQARLEDEKASLIDLLRRISQLGNQIQALDMQRSSLAGQMDRLHARQAQITDQCQTTLAEKAQLQARRDQIEELIAARTAQLDQKTAQSAAVAEARKRLEADLAAAKERRSALESRQHLLAELIRNREGVAEGARQVLRQRDADPAGRRFGFVRGLVADLFEADSSHAAIIEAALHPFDQYLVVDDAAALFEQIEQFAGLGGRVEAFCLDRLGPLVDGRDFSQQDGFVAHALQWVRYPADCEHLARHLLGKTVIVDSLAHARRLAELIPSGYRFVTLAGHILEPDGRISLGPLASQVGLITRRSELRELGRDLAELQQQITRLSEHRDELARQAEQLAQAQQELRTAIYQAQAARAEIDASLRSNAEAARRLSHEQPLITAELEALQQQITEAQQRQEDCRHDLQQLESQHNQRQEQIERLGRQIERLAAERRHLQEQLTQARVLAGQLGQKRTALAEALETTGSALAEAHHAAAETAAELAEATQRIAQAERTILSAQSNLAQLFLKKESQQRQMSDLRRQRELARLELQEIA
ncbi:MAG: chromosome segregation protein SMC, partial [Phycisphaerae bacterium]